MGKEVIVYVIYDKVKNKYLNLQGYYTDIEFCEKYSNENTARRALSNYFGTGELEVKKLKMVLMFV